MQSITRERYRHWRLVRRAASGAKILEKVGDPRLERAIPKLTPRMMLEEEFEADCVENGSACVVIMRAYADDGESQGSSEEYPAS